jgi:hypothetical protein
VARCGMVAGPQRPILAIGRESHPASGAIALCRMGRFSLARFQTPRGFDPTDVSQSAGASRHQCEQAFEQRGRGWRAATYKQVHRDHGGDAVGASIAPGV